MATATHAVPVCPWDTAIKVTGSGFGYIECLVTRTVFNSGKVNAVVNDVTFTDLTTWSIYSSLMPPTRSSIEQSRLWMRHQQEGHHHPPRTRPHQHSMTWFQCQMCCVVYWCLHHHGESSDPLKSGTKRVIISALSADVPMLVMDIDHEITVSNASFTTLGLLGRPSWQLWHYLRTHDQRPCLHWHPDNCGEPWWLWNCSEHHHWVHWSC